MFQKLPTNTHIYGLSAANPSESSWGTYCSPDDVVQGKHVGSCLGDLFSVNFLEDMDKGNIFDETLQDQFKIVQKLTSLSHVLQWGDLSFQTDKVSDYVAGKKKTNNLRTVLPIVRVGRHKGPYASMNSRTMKLQSLSAIYARDHSPELFQQMTQEMASMQKYDSAFKHFDSLLHLDGTYDSAEINYDCLRQAVDAHEQHCGRLSDYGLQFVKNMAEACEKHETKDVLAALKC
jgi:legumain